MTDRTWSDEYVEDANDGSEFDDMMDYEEEDIASDFSIVDIEGDSEDDEEDALAFGLAAYLAGEDDDDWEPDSWDDDGADSWSGYDPE